MDIWFDISLSNYRYVVSMYQNRLVESIVINIHNQKSFKRVLSNYFLMPSI